MVKSMSLHAAAGLGGMLKDGHKTFEGVRSGDEEHRGSEGYRAYDADVAGT
jgi:hypothetical protein